MSTARADILDSIRRSLGREGLDAATEAGLRQRLTAHRRQIGLARTDKDHAELVTLFKEMATALAATVTHIPDSGAVPEAVATYLAEQNLPAQLVVAPALQGMPWAERPTLEVRFGKAVNEDLVSVTPVIGAVAETGTLVLTSGPESPTSLNFLPDTHIVVVNRSQITGRYEDVWDKIRDNGALPRTVNMISGPSRTGDIEQTIQLGAHGPRRLHILILDEA
ncbi:MAG: LutC/YkgG family protein [Elstera sp.]